MTAPAIEVTIVRDGRRVTITGSIRTQADRDLFREQLLAIMDAGGGPVVDVEHAGHVDVAMLILLVVIAKRCAETGKVLELVGVTDEQREMMRITNIDQVLALRGAKVSARPAA